MIYIFREGFAFLTFFLWIHACFGFFLSLVDFISLFTCSARVIVVSSFLDMIMLIQQNHLAFRNWNKEA